MSTIIKNIKNPILSQNTYNQISSNYIPIM